MIKREKILLIALIVMIVLLGIKSYVLDPYSPSEVEETFYNKVEGIIADQYEGFLYDTKLVTFRIVKISEMSERERTVKDKDGNAYIADGIYKAKIRKYILGILPFSEERILDLKEEL